MVQLSHELEAISDCYRDLAKTLPELTATAHSASRLDSSHITKWEEALESCLHVFEVIFSTLRESRSSKRPSKDLTKFHQALQNLDATLKTGLCPRSPETSDADMESWILISRLRTHFLRLGETLSHPIHQ